jgi:membrane carboxypeptidase/penicillin-binding protein PbpC
VGVWVGNSDNAPMQEVAGVNGAGVIWRQIMDVYHQGRPIQQFTRPAGIAEATICAHTGALAGEACPSPMTERFVAGTEPKASDIFFKQVRVGGAGDCLAASYTPPDQAREEKFAVYPAEFREWAISAGIPQPPNTYCPPPQDTPDTAVALITQPAASATITTTQVFVRGAARGSYVLEFGAGREPTEWQPVASGPGPIADGILGLWKTDALPPGEYTLRLKVTTTDGVPLSVTTTVQLRS